MRRPYIVTLPIRESYSEEFLESEVKDEPCLASVLLKPSINEVTFVSFDCLKTFYT